MTPSIERLHGELVKLPGVGNRTAERLAYHLLRVSREEAIALADAIRSVRDQTRPCSVCGHLDEADPCSICRDDSRDRGSILVVEESRDLYAFERTGEHRGLYHVLGGRMAPLEGRAVEAEALEKLKRRVVAGGVREVILATNADVEGDATALAVTRALESHPVRVTRLARGMPPGSSIEFAGAGVLKEALAYRNEIRRERTGRS